MHIYWVKKLCVTLHCVTTALHHKVNYPNSRVEVIKYLAPQSIINILIFNDDVDHASVTAIWYLIDTKHEDQRNRTDILVNLSFFHPLLYPVKISKKMATKYLQKIIWMRCHSVQHPHSATSSGAVSFATCYFWCL